MGIKWHLAHGHLHFQLKMMILLKFSWRRTPNFLQKRVVEMSGGRLGDLGENTEQVLLQYRVWDERAVSIHARSLFIHNMTPSNVRDQSTNISNHP